MFQGKIVEGITISPQITRMDTDYLNYFSVKICVICGASESFTLNTQYWILIGNAPGFDDNRAEDESHDD